ncbi:MAG: hypothetical protein GX173_10790 [Ruminococcaceae bacterium]|nr:hypothetical protein [Oscillospiraceae bacterium]
MEHLKDQTPDIIIENEHLRLVVGGDCLAKSLIHKPSGEECLAANEEIALFSVTQERPFNNEVKLAHPNKRTVFQANCVRREGNKLIVGFEITPFEAVIEIKEAPQYIGFWLSDFIVHPTDYPGLRMSPPPVAEMRLLQIPIRNRENFGEWLNVSWDSKVAVNVLATAPYARIEADRRKGYRIMSADAVRDIKLKGTGAALIVSQTSKLLDAIAAVEEDYDLPRGVDSRRSPMINVSAYWSGNITPANVDEHITYAKKGGFRCMLVYYTSIFKEIGGYELNGNYDYRDEYPQGKADLKNMLDKIIAAGITPGLHFLHSHIGLKSRYVTPVADHRLNVTKRFTLARALGKEDTVVYVEQNPEGTVMADRCRILKFGGELISYEGYTTEPPYHFTGCKRGAHVTTVTNHPLGLVGGILDVSEFGGTSAYLDQYSSLQDEVADKIADAFNTGFRFVYFDGSEGTNPPFEYHVPNAQYRVLKKLNPAPLFTEGAAKAHFSWHFLSGGNAFDIFDPEVFKEKIREYPAEEAPRMQHDFTRLNFGWWGFWALRTQPDMYEYGTSRAAAWDCPVTIMEKMDAFKTHPRTDDILEVMRRWEDVRAKNWLTAEQKKELQNLEQEHILLINEEKQYELVAYDQITEAANASKDMLAFILERNNERYVVYWHTTGNGTLDLPLNPQDVTLEKELGGEPVPFAAGNGSISIPVADRCYLKSSLTRQQLIDAFKKAVLH